MGAPGMAAAFLVLASTGLAFFLARGPFFAQPLVGEEGLFADLFYNRPPLPDLGLVGRIAGQDERILMIHPTPLYQLIIALGWALEHPWKAAFGQAWRSDAAVRVAFSLFQLPVWMGLAWMLRSALWRRPWSWVPFLALLSAPMAVGGSLFLQTDSSAGVLFPGLFGLALPFAERRGWDKPLALAALAAAAFACGLVAKQEWTLGLLAGTVLAALWPKPAGAGRALAFSACALLLGSAASWALHPAAYEGGLHLSQGIGAGHTGRRLLDYWRTVFAVRLPFLAALGAAWLGLAWPRGRGSLAGTWALLSSVCLSLPYLLTSWTFTYRYFLPGFFVACPAFLALGLEGARPLGRGMLAGCAVLGLAGALYLAGAWAQGRSVTELHGMDLGKYLAYQHARAEGTRDLDCVLQASQGQFWDRRGRDWVADSLSPGEAQALARRRGRQLCP